MRATAVTLYACAALALLQAGCFWRRQEGAQIDASATPAPAASPAADAAPAQPPLPPGSDARAYFERGKQNYRDDRDAQAAEDFREAIRLDPSFAEAHYRLGLALSAAGQDEEAEKAFKEAVAAYEKVLKEEPKNSDAQYFLGLSQAKLGEYEKAVKAFKESIKNAPEEDDDRYYELGLAHYKLAQYAESVKALNKALEINPDNYPASDMLERAKSGAERRAEFLKRQEQLRKQHEQRGNSNANSNAGANSNANRPAPPAPTPAQ